MSNDRVHRRFWVRALRWVSATLAALVGIALALLLVIAYVWQPGVDRSHPSAFLRTHRTQYVDAGGFRIHYWHEGSGPPLVLVHGGQVWLDDWKEVMQPLAEHFSVYALDMPGQGYTKNLKADVRYDLATESSAIKAFIDSQHLGQVMLVGHSDGGGWALDFTGRYPEKVSRLVLVGSSGIPVSVSGVYGLMQYPVLGEAMSKLFSWNDVRSGLQQAFFHKELVTDAYVWENYVPLTFPQNRRAMYELANENFTRTEKILNHLPVPTLLIWGEHDGYLAPGEQARFIKAATGASTVIIPNCGHAAQLDCPAEFLGVVLPFLSATPQPTRQS